MSYFLCNMKNSSLLMVLHYPQEHLNGSTWVGISTSNTSPKYARMSSAKHLSDFDIVDTLLTQMLIVGIKIKEKSLGRDLDP
jgi:hypothetical protein